MHNTLRISCIAVLCISCASLTEAYEGSEPLDTHTEQRLSGYISNDVCPHTYRNTERGVNEKIRCEYLLKQVRDLAASRLEARSRIRQRSIAERFYKSDKTPITGKEAYGVFDPYGPGSDILVNELREAQMHRYAENDNCPSYVLNKAELARCLYLIDEIDDIRRQTIAQRRIVSRFTRVVQSQPHDFATRQKSTNIFDTKSSTTGQTASQNQHTAASTHSFDTTGLGSIPLNDATEQRLSRYISNGGECPLNSKQDVRERCMYLLQLKNAQRVQGLDRMEQRLRARGLYQPITRGVDTQYRNRLQSAQGVVRSTKEQQGYYLRPRTRAEVEERYKKAVVVPGDCQIDVKLCNK